MLSVGLALLLVVAAVAPPICVDVVVVVVVAARVRDEAVAELVIADANARVADLVPAPTVLVIVAERAGGFMGNRLGEVDPPLPPLPVVAVVSGRRSDRVRLKALFEDMIVLYSCTSG